MTFNICWLVPPPIKGSGGHRTFYNHIQMLHATNNTITIYIVTPPHMLYSHNWVKDIYNWFNLDKDINIRQWPPQVKKRFDIAVATWCLTIYELEKIDCEHKVCFVQDFEPYFFPIGDDYIKAEQSYYLDFIPITIGKWLSTIMQSRYQKKASCFEFTADLTIYKPIAEIEKERAICFICQPEKHRRCPRLGGEALYIVKQIYPEINIYTYGSNESPNFNFPHTHLGLLSLQECNRLYNRCQVGLCLSSSNPSRIPFEMMATGLPVVEIYGQHTIYDLPEDGTLLATPTPEALASAICEIIENKTLQKKLCTGGFNFMQTRPASLELSQSQKLLMDILENRFEAKKATEPLYQKPPFNKKLPIKYIEPESIYITNPAKEENSYQKKQERFAMGIVYWLLNNRISRAIKIIIKGHL